MGFLLVSRKISSNSYFGEKYFLNLLWFSNVVKLIGKDDSISLLDLCSSSLVQIASLFVFQLLYLISALRNTCSIWSWTCCLFGLGHVQDPVYLFKNKTPALCGECVILST